MKNTQLDEDGYPSETTLSAIEEWDCIPSGNMAKLLEFVRDAWRYKDYFTQAENGQWNVSTAGWSGNEDLIGAMKKNFLFWSMCWVQARRGGHYIFEIPEIAAPSQIERKIP